jgi:hypothetical protein
MKQIKTAEKFWEENKELLTFSEIMVKFTSIHIENCKEAIWEEFEGGVDEDMREVLFNVYPISSIE